MKDLSTLTDKILDEAKLQAQATLDAANSDVQNILKAAQAEADTAAEQIAQNAKHQCEAIHRRAQSQAGIEERSMLLGARRNAIDSAFRLALEKLCAYPQDKVADFLAALAAKYQTVDAELIFNAKDAELGKLVCQKLSAGAHKAELSSTQGSFAGGFIIKEGSVETNCTFEVLIKGIADEVEADVAQILFA